MTSEIISPSEIILIDNSNAKPKKQVSYENPLIKNESENGSKMSHPLKL